MACFERERLAVAVFIVLTWFMSISLTRAKDKDLCNKTNQGRYCKCTQCSKTGSTGSCSYSDPGDASTVSCVCIEGYKGRHCDQCDNGWFNNNASHGIVSCVRCNCSGPLVSDNICDWKTGKCNLCLPNVTGSDCSNCIYNCSVGGIPSGRPFAQHKASSHRKVRDAIIITVCAIIGLLCITATGYLIYRHKKLGRIRGRIPKYFWTVELSNRNFDDLDFSLLDPVSDTPFVYRNDTNEFEEALIQEEKSQLRLDMDVLHEEDEEDTGDTYC